MSSTNTNNNEVEDALTREAHATSPPMSAAGHQNAIIEAVRVAMSNMTINSDSEASPSEKERVVACGDACDTKFDASKSVISSRGAVDGNEKGTKGVDIEKHIRSEEEGNKGRKEEKEGEDSQLKGLQEYHSGPGSRRELPQDADAAHAEATLDGAQYSQDISNPTRSSPVSAEKTNANGSAFFTSQGNGHSSGVGRTVSERTLKRAASEQDDIDETDSIVPVAKRARRLTRCCRHVPIKYTDALDDVVFARGNIAPVVEPVGGNGY